MLLPVQPPPRGLGPTFLWYALDPCHLLLSSNCSNWWGNSLYQRGPRTIRRGSFSAFCVSMTSQLLEHSILPLLELWLWSRERERAQCPVSSTAINIPAPHSSKQDPEQIVPPDSRLLLVPQTPRPLPHVSTTEVVWKTDAKRPFRFPTHPEGGCCLEVLGRRQIRQTRLFNEWWTREESLAKIFSEFPESKLTPLTKGAAWCRGN